MNNIFALYNTTLACDSNVISCDIYCNSSFQFISFDETCYDKCAIDSKCLISNSTDHIMDSINNTTSVLIDKISSISEQLANEYESGCNQSNSQNLFFDAGYASYRFTNITNNNTNGAICCRGFESCGYSSAITAGDLGSILCLGDSACTQSSLTASSIYCMAYNSCTLSKLQSANIIVCATYGACQNSSIMTGKTVYCFKESCSNTTIESVDTIYLVNHQGAIDITTKNKSETFIYFFGRNAGDELNFVCEKNSVCHIYCSIGACNSNTTRLLCDGKCFVTCNSTLTRIDCVNILSSTAPSASPSQPPTNHPTTAPSLAPTQAPTNFYCDSTVQTNDTYSVCIFLMMFEQIDTLGADSLKLSDYCELTQYFNCSSSTTTDHEITSILLSNGLITSELTTTLLQASPHKIQQLDLSNNNLYGTVEEWSILSQLRVLNLANNSLSGSVAFSQLTRESDQVESPLRYINLSNNNWDAQSIDWGVFEYCPYLKKLDLSNNQFGGTIEFQDVSNLVYLNLANNSFSAIYGFDEIKNVESLKEFYVNDNIIDEEFDLSWLPDGITIVHCSNNTLFGDLNMNDIPTSLVKFDCRHNDFGILEWETSESNYLEYNLEYLSLSNAHLNGEFKMQVFDSDATFANLKYVDLSFNSELNLTINFEYLSGSQMEYFNVLGIKSAGKADFTYLTDSIIIKMEKMVVCVDSICADESGGRTVSWTRSNETCIGAQKCVDTCTCVTEYDAGIYEYMESQFIGIFFYVLVVVVIAVLFCGFAGLGYNKHVCGRKQIWRCNKRDDFLIGSLIGYVFQLWDFFSDLLLCYDIYDHWYQEPRNSDKYHLYSVFVGLSATFIFLP